MQVTITKNDGTQHHVEDAHASVTFEGDVWVLGMEDNIIATYDAGTWAHVTVTA